MFECTVLEKSAFWQLPACPGGFALHTIFYRVYISCVDVEPSSEKVYVAQKLSEKLLNSNNVISCFVSKLFARKFTLIQVFFKAGIGN